MLPRSHSVTLIDAKFKLTSEKNVKGVIGEMITPLILDKLGDRKPTAGIQFQSLRFKQQKKSHCTHTVVASDS